MLSRIKVKTEPSDMLLEISLEVDRQSISQHPLGTELAVISVHASLVHQTLLCVLTECLLNSTCAIHVPQP